MHKNNYFIADRKGMVKVAIPMLADLFGIGVRVENAAVMNDGTILLIVSGHESLPIVGPGDTIHEVQAIVSDAGLSKRSVEFHVCHATKN